MHYTADGKNGFVAVVKTHGPNSHPVQDEHGNVTDDDVTHSQSKINHYSKDQEHILLSSDLHPHKKPIIDLNKNEQRVPSLYELHPHVHPEKHGPEHIESANRFPDSRYQDTRFHDNRFHDDRKHHHFNYGEEFHPYESRASIQSVDPPNLMKHRPSEQFMPEDSRDQMEEMEEMEGDVLEHEVYPKYVKPHTYKMTRDKITDGVIYGQAKAHVKPLVGYWPKFWDRRGRNKKEHNSNNYYLRPIKTTKGSPLYSDEADRRIASSRMVQTLIARTAHGAYPVYAHRNVNYS